VAAGGPGLGAGWVRQAGPRRQAVRCAHSLDSCGESGADYAGRGPGAWVHVTASVDSSVVLGPGAVVGAGSVVGAGCVLMANSVVGAGCRIGEGTSLGPCASVHHADVGSHCIIHAGARIGADGFGFFHDPESGMTVKKPQELRVVVGDHVELGANSCVDRGSWRDTVLGNHVKVDNLVQIGHNAVVGDHCILCGHVALGGSSSLGDHVVMGGKSAVADHVEVAAGTMLAGKTGVMKSIKESGVYAGFPAEPVREWRRGQVRLRQLLRKTRHRHRHHSMHDLEHDR